jgi:hypothetical protein
MNRQWSIFLTVLVISLPAIYWLPWWTSAIVGFLAVFIFQKGASRQSFWIPGIAGALAWVVLTGWQDTLNQQILSKKIAHLFSLPSPYILWLIEGLIGYITTGLGGWLAGSFKKENHYHRAARKS